jgi:hypothetical protein
MATANAAYRVLTQFRGKAAKRVRGNHHARKRKEQNQGNHVMTWITGTKPCRLI